MPFSYWAGITWKRLVRSFIQCNSRQRSSLWGSRWRYNESSINRLRDSHLEIGSLEYLRSHCHLYTQSLSATASIVLRISLGSIVSCAAAAIADVGLHLTRRYPSFYTENSRAFETANDLLVFGRGATNLNLLEYYSNLFNPLTAHLF